MMRAMKPVPKITLLASASALIVAVTVLGYFVEPLLGYRSVGFFFLLAVIVIGFFGPLSIVVFAAALSGIVWDYFFIPPRWTLAIGSVEDFLMIVTFFGVALITGLLTNRVRRHEAILRERQWRTRLLYEILQDIAFATGKSDFLSKVVLRVGSLLDTDCGVVLKSPEGELQFRGEKSYSVLLDERDQGVALWSFQNGQLAGWSTGVLSRSSALFLPLRGLSETVGVFVARPRHQESVMDAEQLNLLESIVRQLGLSLERHFLNKRLADAERWKDSEKLHQTLLNSVSHEIRTPLTTILASVHALEEDRVISQSPETAKIVSGLQNAGDRLNRVIENLLDMSRLNSGALSLRLEWHDFNDLLGVVAQKLEGPLKQHALDIEFMPEPVLVKMDYRLMEHAISNVLLNAALYSPEGATIRVSLRPEQELFKIGIEDQGPGIQEEFLPKIFDKFYRVPGSPTGGTGLGLSIVKSIVELHKGLVTATNLQPCGIRFEITLPLETQPERPEEIDL